MSIDVVTPREPEHDPWALAQKYWDGVAVDHPDVAKGLAALAQYRETCKKPEKDGKPIELLVAMAGDQETVERTGYPRNPERKIWGALPHFQNRHDVIATFVKNQFGVALTPKEMQAPLTGSTAILLVGSVEGKRGVEEE